MFNQFLRNTIISLMSSTYLGPNIDNAVFACSPQHPYTTDLVTIVDLRAYLPWYLPCFHYTFTPEYSILLSIHWFCRYHSSGRPTVRHSSLFRRYPQPKHPIIIHILCCRNKLIEPWTVFDNNGSCSKQCAGYRDYGSSTNPSRIKGIPIWNSHSIYRTIVYTLPTEPNISYTIKIQYIYTFYDESVFIVFIATWIPFWQSCTIS